MVFALGIRAGHDQTRPARMSRSGQSGTESWPAGVLTAGVGICVVVADQAAKAWAVASLSPPIGARSLLAGWLRLVLITNNGAAFGLLGGSNLLFVMVGLVICAVVMVYAYLPSHIPILQASLGLQLGGAIGNLTDRVRIGHVVDFIQIKYWPIFNLADSAIVCGVGLLVYYLMSNPDGPRSGGRRGPNQAPRGRL
jgi:signal peptidase II